MYIYQHYFYCAYCLIGQVNELDLWACQRVDNSYLDQR